MTRLRVALAVAAMTAIAISSMPAASAIESASSSERAFLERINDERASRGLRRLVVKGDLVRVAREHSARMARRGEIYHNMSVDDQVEGWSQLGENVGTGPTTQKIHDAFMDSAPHRRNILFADFDEAGIGVVVARGALWVTQVFAERPETSSIRIYRTPRVVAAAPATRHETGTVRTRRATGRTPSRTVAVLLRMVSDDDVLA